MAPSDYLDYLLHDLFSHIDGITSRSMFGGHGLYQHGTIFAIVVDNELYFKVDASNQGDFEAYQSSPFVYTSRGKEMSMSYWRLPVEIQEDAEALATWVERSVTISRSGKSNQMSKTTKKPSATKSSAASKKSSSTSKKPTQRTKGKSR